MKQRDLRRQLRGAAHMVNGIAEPAILVGDDPQKVLGLGGIRLRLQNLSADGLRFQQHAVGAAALGVYERLAKRHECRVWLGLIHRGPDYHGACRTAKATD